MRVDVELRQDGQQAQQQLTAVGQQQQANEAREQTIEPIFFGAVKFPL